MKYRTRLLNTLIQERRYEAYLEIGCARNTTFDAIRVRQKVGVDPVRGGTVRMTSDEFFQQNRHKFDLVFIDGLHLCEQVLRDVDHALGCLNPGGMIVLHDCLPQHEQQQLRELRTGSWTGDVWKAVAQLRQRSDCDVAVLDKDWGLGFVLPRPNTDPLPEPGPLTWELYRQDKAPLLRVLDEVGTKQFIDGDASAGTRRSPNHVGRALLPVPAPPLRDCGSRTRESSVLPSGSEVSRLPLRTNSQHVCISEPSRKAPDTGSGTRKLTIVFAHSNLAQFRVLHEYLNESGLATSYLICSETNFKKHRDRIPNLVPFKPHGGKLKGPESFYYLTRVEGANRRSLGILKSLQTLQARTPIDLYVGHVTAGSPSMFFDEVRFPIITYMEFPSFRAHGWDANYPPPEMKALRDKSFEMLSFQAALKSDHVLVPSQYAKSVFPPLLQQNISVQMEGFRFDGEPERRTAQLEKHDGRRCVGFAARDVSTAKGFEQFVRIAKQILARRANVQFVVLGSDNPSYSYENHFLDRLYGPGHKRTFRDYVLEHEGVDCSRFTCTGLLPYDAYSRYIHDVDLFLYPLQFGSANWGLFELLARGKLVIASNRCFVPEVIQDGVNGFLCDYDDVTAWVERAIEILDAPDRFQSIAANARRTAQQYDISTVAQDYMAVFRRVIQHRVSPPEPLRRA